MENKKTDTGEKLKKGAIIILPVVFALVAAILAALMVGGARKAPEGESSAPEATSSAPPVTDAVAPPESTPSDGYSKGLEYRSGENGTCTIVGLGGCTDKTVKIPEVSPDGEVVIGIGARAFAGKDIIEIRIPASVLSVGEGAFAGCTSLKAINADGASPMFSSVGGVLFDREMKELICYPSGREDSTYVIPKSVTKISAMAFSSCKNLTRVKYAGTEKQWKDVYVCAGNDSLDMNKMIFAPEEK